jgi:flagellar biosynthesis/type III secretory pathway protein FliH
MDNTRLNPAFDKIVGDFMKLSAYAPAPAANPAEVATYRVPTDTGELAQLMGDVYRDAHATGYAEGFTDGDIQGNEDAQRAADDKAETITHMVIKYAELWAESRRAISNMECVIRQLAEMDNGQIKATLQGTVWCLQAQLDKGDN